MCSSFQVQICIVLQERTRLWGGKVPFSSSNPQFPLAMADWQGLLGLVPVPEQVSAGIGGQLARFEIWRHVPRHPAERLRPYLQCTMVASALLNHCKGGLGLGPMLAGGQKPALWCGSTPGFLIDRVSGEAAAPGQSAASDAECMKPQLCRQQCQGSLSYISHDTLNAGSSRTDRSLSHGQFLADSPSQMPHPSQGKQGVAASVAQLCCMPQQYAAQPQAACDSDDYLH